MAALLFMLVELRCGLCRGEERRQEGGGGGAENGRSVNGAFMPPMLVVCRRTAASRASGALMACRPPRPTSLEYGRPLHVQMPLGLLPAGLFVRSPGELRQHRSTPRSGSAVRDRVER